MGKLVIFTVSVQRPPAGTLDRGIPRQWGRMHLLEKGAVTMSDLDQKASNLILNAVDASVDAAYLKLKEDGLNEINGRLERIEGHMESEKIRTDFIVNAVRDIRAHLGIDKMGHVLFDDERG